MDNLPEWLVDKDNYKPDKDKDAFIDKSILSIFKVLSRFRRGTGYNIGSRNLNPSVKLTFILLFVLLVTLSRNPDFVVGADIMVLVVVSLFGGRQIRHLLKTAFAALTFSLIILLPAIIMGNIHNSMVILLKVAGTVTVVNIFSITTQWNEASGALRSFFVPDIFIFVLDITIKYISLLGEFSMNMLWALKKRAVGVNKDKNSPLTAVMGTMFIKSREMAEEMQGAMECRGFTGEYRHPAAKTGFKPGDFALMAAGVIMIILYFYYGRVL
ncbi:MAG: energy-coupling factor transporter transmembrane component T [Bacillota bacterium]|nr:energy-coupling factor transporter transmembrane component T [Bacillota bacterium]